jgi:hypothetical protein
METAREFDPMSLMNCTIAIMSSVIITEGAECVSSFLFKAPTGHSKLRQRQTGSGSCRLRTRADNVDFHSLLAFPNLPSDLALQAFFRQVMSR